jgi:LAS superfamily LD-carboxypeptidase LdcB
MSNFYTDVISPDQRFDSVARVADLSLLEPITRQLVQGIVLAAQQMGIEIMAFETYRSQARQQQLFNQGATKLRTVGRTSLWLGL